METEEKSEIEETEEEKKIGEAKKIEENIVEERIYTIPLSKAWISPRKKRAPRAIRILKNFIGRHMKPKTIILTDDVNERIWRRGIEKPPRKIRIRAAKDQEGTVTVHLAEGE